MQENFQPPKVLIEMEEYNHLKSIEKKQEWTPLNEGSCPQNGEDCFLSNGEHYAVGYREYDEWRFKAGVYFTPTHYKDMKPCLKPPPTKIDDNDDLPF